MGTGIFLGKSNNMQFFPPGEKKWAKLGQLLSFLSRGGGGEGWKYIQVHTGLKFDSKVKVGKEKLNNCLTSAWGPAALDFTFISA